MNMVEVSAYIAGLIDGEGSIGLDFKSSNDKFRRPVISIGSTTLELLQFVKFYYGGCISKHKLYKEHHKQSWVWKICNDKAIQFLQSIQQYLIVPEKKKRSELITKEYKQVTKRNGKYTKEQIIIKKDFENRFFNN